MRHHRYHLRHHHHRGHNPFGVDQDVLSKVGWGVVGGVATRAIGATVLSAYNTGFTGYIANAATAIALKFVGGMFSKQAGDGLLIGGLIATGVRIVQEQLGSKIPGLSGYVNSYFAVPTVSDPYGRVAGSPYPQPVLAPAAAAGTMGRYGDRFRRHPLMQ